MFSFYRLDENERIILCGCTIMLISSVFYCISYKYCKYSICDVYYHFKPLKYTDSDSLLYEEV